MNITYTKRFTSGILEGATYLERRNVGAAELARLARLSITGQTVEPCVGSSAYVIEDLEVVE